ncbi:hypothetical protein SNE40_003352 [Patella caerulea]|uniref:Uncharacterized protein n=1 Tax=Patella caerulea TaxID=87958 RepID=A0AAN8Q8I7_PATCE
MNRADVSVERLFDVGVFTITGGRDKYGNHIISMPAHNLEIMESLETEQLVDVLQKFLSWQKLIYSTCPQISLLINLKHTRKLVIQFIVDALAMLEAMKLSCIQMIYIVKPGTIVKSYLLKKLLTAKTQQVPKSNTNLQVN